MKGYNPYNLTQKQRWIMAEVIQGNVDPISGERLSDLDLDQLIERLGQKYPNYEPSKQALQFSIRYLCRKGLLSKDEMEARRGRRRRLLESTPLGITIFTTKLKSGEPEPGVVMEGFDELPTSDIFDSELHQCDGSGV